VLSFGPSAIPPQVEIARRKKPGLQRSIAIVMPGSVVENMHQRSVVFCFSPLHDCPIAGHFHNFVSTLDSSAVSKYCVSKALHHFILSASAGMAIAYQRTAFCLPKHHMFGPSTGAPAVSGAPLVLWRAPEAELMHRSGSKSRMRSIPESLFAYTSQPAQHHLEADRRDFEST
jgi:hypothetical protein